MKKEYRTNTKRKPEKILAINSLELLNLRRAVAFYREVRAENSPIGEEHLKIATTLLIAAAFLVIDTIDIDNTVCDEKLRGEA